MKAYWGVDIQLHTYSISELGGIEWPPLSWYALNEGWMISRADVDTLEKKHFSCLCRESNYESSVVRPIA
jgi:hypothetical protein